MGAGLHNSRSSASGASLGGLREKHFSYGYGTTRRPLSQPAIALCKCTSSRVGALIPAVKLALQVEYCARAPPDAAVGVLPLASLAVHGGAVARFPLARLVLLSLPLLCGGLSGSGAARAWERASAPLRRGSISASATACTPLPAAAAVHGVQRKPRPPRVWPTQPLLVRLQPRRAPFLPRGSSVPAPSARHGPWLIGWRRPRTSIEGGAARTRLPVVACGVLHYWLCCRIIV